MHRTQLLLHEWQYDALKNTAERRGMSLSALVREILAKHLERRSARARKRLLEIDGVAEGPSDLAENHDEYLYGAASERRKRKKR